ncbi:MAG: radical SAM protein [Candidatus Thermoplasmatota archaeon]
MSFRTLIVDGYVDEPASLGVPPYISPLARYVYGALADAGCAVRYLTIDQVREGRHVPSADMLIAIKGAVVPGRYLRGMPATSRELCTLARSREWEAVIGGAGVRFGANPEIAYAFDHIVTRDMDAYLHDMVQKGVRRHRWRTPEEWRRWSIMGAEVARMHPDFPEPLIAEIDTSRGCVRYFTGGCNFCIEPSYGRPYFRAAEDVAAEVQALHHHGVVHFRLGGQSCIYSHMAGGIGGTETPVPNPRAVRALLVAVRHAAPHLKVLHLDNANPAVIAEHPEEAREVTEVIVEHCTPGNVLALGMESADPAVIERSNLNARPAQVLAAVRMINEIGGMVGGNGMPLLLPGINFLAGLDGESKRTFELNYSFLRTLLDEGLVLRRINIRQVASLAREFPPTRYYREFRKFKERVRREIDLQMMRCVTPRGRVLRRVYTEIRIGGCTYGRQIGSYPILVTFPYHAELHTYKDALVTGHGPRSLTAVETPLSVNTAPMGALEALPGIGKRRAMRIAAGRPFRDLSEFLGALDDRAIGERVAEHLCFE